VEGFFVFKTYFIVTNIQNNFSFYTSKGIEVPNIFSNFIKTSKISDVLNLF